VVIGFSLFPVEADKFPDYLLSETDLQVLKDVADEVTGNLTGA